MSRIFTGITLGHVRTQGDILTMQRHGIAQAGNVVNLSAVCTGNPLPPTSRGGVAVWPGQSQFKEAA